MLRCEAYATRDKHREKEKRETTKEKKEHLRSRTGLTRSESFKLRFRFPAAPSSGASPQLRCDGDTHCEYKKMPGEAIMSPPGLTVRRYRLIETLSEVVWRQTQEVSAIGE